MTRSYILKRILWLFPAWFVVLAIAFVLKHSVPGDPVETVLMQRGISTQEMERHQSTYAKIYKEERFHWPVFYFSIVPSYYPDNIQGILSPERRNSTELLLEKGYPYTILSGFLDSCDHWQLSIPSGEKDKVRAWQQILRFDRDPEVMVDFLKRHTIYDSVQETKMENYLGRVLQHKVLISRPGFRWHGCQNQFHNYLKKALTLHFGKSAVDGKMVTAKIGGALSWTLVLISLSLCLLFLISIPLGLWSGRFEKSKLDVITEKVSVFLYAVPVFWLASMLIIFFTSKQYGAWMHIFPSVGTWYLGDSPGFWAAVWSHGKHLILPVLCLTANDFAFLIRLIKVNTIAEKNKPYIKVAISRGLADRDILWKQVLPNVGVSLIAVFMGLVPAAFAGSLIVEVIFNVPGMGRLLYSSLLASDWNVVFAILILLSGVTIIFNLLGDILIARLNPKIRYGQVN